MSVNEFAVITLTVAVEPETDGPDCLTSAYAAARAGYEQIRNMDFLPVVTVKMQDGTVTEVDLEVDGPDEDTTYHS